MVSLADLTDAEEIGGPFAGMSLTTMQLFENQDRQPSREDDDRIRRQEKSKRKRNSHDDNDDDDHNDFRVNSSKKKSRSLHIPEQTARQASSDASSDLEMALLDDICDGTAACPSSSQSSYFPAHDIAIFHNTNDQFEPLPEQVQSDTAYRSEVSVFQTTQVSHVKTKVPNPFNPFLLMREGMDEIKVT